MKTLLLIVALSLPVSAQLWSGVLSASRATDWTGAGVVGGIPTWSRCTVGTGSSILPSSSTAAQINSAISNCDVNHYVELGAGTFSLSTGIILKTGVSVHGQGANQTILNFSNTAGCSGSFSVICAASSDLNYNLSPQNPTGWSSGYAKGSTTITLTVVTNLAVGRSIMLDQLDDSSDSGAIFVDSSTTTAINGDGGSPRAGRGQQQFVIVASCDGISTVGHPCSSGTNITISPAIRMPNWAGGKTPQAWWSGGPISMTGVENLSIDATNAGAIKNITFFNCQNCWVKGIRSIGPTNAATNPNWRSHVQMFQSHHITVQDNYFFGTPDDPSVNYGVESFPSSDSLVQNNIFEHVQAPYPEDGTCSGCVFSYNFDVNNQFDNTTFTFQNQSGFPHSVGADNYLYEGNIGSGLYFDNFHGSKHLITSFRNYWNGFQEDKGTTPTQGTTPVLFNSYSRLSNIIGSVLGNPAKHDKYKNATPAANTGNPLLEIGYGAGAVGADINTVTTAMLWGNFANCLGAPPCQTNIFDSAEVPSGLTGAQAPFLNAVPATQVLPPSFYLAAQPSWWTGGKAWPSIGPDVTGGNVKYCTGGTNDGTYVLTSAQCPGGTATTLAGGRIVSNPAMDCYLNTMGGPTNGVGSVLTFNAMTCYSASSSATATFTPSSINFGNQLLGVPSNAQPISLSNTGTATMNIASIVIGGANSTDFSQSNNCASTLAVSASCTINVVFTPTSVNGRVGSVIVTSDASNSPTVAGLSGTGILAFSQMNGVSITGAVTIH